MFCISDLCKVMFPFYAYLPGHMKANSISSSIMLCVPKSPLSKCFMPLWWENGPLLAAVKLRLYCDFYNYCYLYKNCKRQNGLAWEYGNSPTDSKASSHTSSDAGSLTGEICCLSFILKLLTIREWSSPWITAALLGHSLPIQYFPTWVHLCFPFSDTKFRKGWKGSSLTILGHLESLPSHPCSHTLTTSPAHLWPPHHPSRFLTNLAWVSRMIHGAIKLSGGDLKGQLIQPRN